MLQRLLIPTLAIVLAGNAATAQNKKVEMGLGYSASTPMGSLMEHSNVLHSFNIGAMYLIPGANRLGVGIELNTGSYASFTKNQVFGFNGTSTPTNVHYNSNVTSGGLLVRYNVIQKDNYSIFGNVKGGLTSYTSKLQIEDPHDMDGCAPMETRNLIDDYTWQAGARVGANVDVKAFARNVKGKTLFIQPYVGYTQGGNVDYINVKKSTTDHSMHTTGSTTGDNTGGTALNMPFVNLGTNEQHDHEVARVYNSPVQYIDAGISLVVRF